MQNDNNQIMVLDNTITNNIVNIVDTEKNIIEENKIVINEITNNIKSENKKDNEKENNKKETSKTEMEKDAEKVLKLCKFKKPLNGVITSEFGEREATIQGMTTDHKGIDIAAQSGTNIKAAITGTVSVAEQNSEYGKFIKIVNGNVMTVYAHCKELKVKKGDKVKLGQTIATVGSTGNSTGPHLHFEIRLENRYINPQYVIKF
jgi:murein DD-endopeptidase MepM/ murein hydrolase activator NlpD